MSALKLFPTALAATAGLWCGAAESSGFDWTINKSCAQYVRIENNMLTVDVPHGVTNVCAYATAEIDLSDWMFSMLEAEVMCKAERLERSPRPHRGLKVSLFYFDTSREFQRMRYPNAAAVPQDGGFDWQPLRLSVLFGENPPGTDPKPRLVLGLQQTPGRAIFDLSTFKCRKASPPFPRQDNDYQIKYPEHVLKRGAMRGVMCRGLCRNTEQDVEDLKNYGANLLRLHMNGFTQYVKKHGLKGTLDDWNAWLRMNMDHAEEVLGWLEKRNMMMVLDMHNPPLRTPESRSTVHEKGECADRFVSAWEEIARRFNGRKGLYGYDLINEPAQYGTALPDCDYWNLQRRAAEAIRKIDPEATIIVAANEYSASHAFLYLRALEMDNVIYQVHFYKPFKYTHQGVNGAPRPQKGSEMGYPERARGWTKDYLRECLKPVVDFQRRHGAKIFVGEFSASIYSPGAGRYLSDCIDLFEEYGWDWTYHAFREAIWWDVESVPTENPGERCPNRVNDRFRALFEGFHRVR